MEDNKSDIGVAIHTPCNPNNPGNISINGIKIITCLLSDKIIAVDASPMAWKKFDETIWKPTIGNIAVNILIPYIPISKNS